MLARHRPCAALVLFSPLMSVKDVANDKMSSGILGMLAPNMFRNIDLIGSVNCPTFIIHGNRDEVIDVRHANELMFRSGAHPHQKHLHLVPHMTHNYFELDNDFIVPSLQFFTNMGLVGSNNPNLTRFNFSTLGIGEPLKMQGLNKDYSKMNEQNSSER